MPGTSHAHPGYVLTVLRGQLTLEQDMGTPCTAKRRLLFPNGIVSMSKLTFKLNGLTQPGNSGPRYSKAQETGRYPDPMIPTLGEGLDLDMLDEYETLWDEDVVGRE